MQDEHLEPALLKRRSTEERAQLFKRMRGDFGTLKVSKVLQASAEAIQVAIPNKEGVEATFTFSFEAQPPNRISALSVEIDRGDR